MTHGTLVLDPQDVEELFNWHGGQGSAVYALASTAQNDTVTIGMIDDALRELRRDLTRERHYLGQNDLRGRDRDDVEANVDGLHTLIGNLEVVLAHPEEHSYSRLENPIDWDRVRERVSHHGRRAYAYVKEKGRDYGARAGARASAAAEDARDRSGRALRDVRDRHVRQIGGETCVCTARGARQDNPGSTSRLHGAQREAIKSAERFFAHHAGYSMAPGEGREEAQARAGKALAEAERRGLERGWTVEWEHEQYPDVSWMDGEQQADYRSGRIEMLIATLRDSRGEVLGSLGGVALNGRSSGRDPQARVVEAELMLEALAEYRGAPAVRGGRHDNPTSREHLAARHEQVLREYGSELSERVRLGEISDAVANELLAQAQDRLAAEDRASFAAPRCDNPAPLAAQACEWEVETMGDGGWELMRRTITLPHGAGDVEMERALAKVGVYAPRGMDKVSWSKSGAEIRDASGHYLVTLRAHVVRKDNPERDDNPVGRASVQYAVVNAAGEVVAGPFHSKRQAEEEMADREQMNGPYYRVVTQRRGRVSFETGAFDRSERVHRSPADDASAAAFLNSLPPAPDRRFDNPVGSAGAEDVEERGEVLAFEITSDGELYPVRKEVETALRARVARGTYDSRRAPQAFAFYVEEGARKLAREAGEGARWHDVYPAPVRRVAARIIAENVEAEMRRESHEAAANRAIFEERSPAEGGGRRDNPAREDNPRAFDQGGDFRVALSEQDIRDFADRWPASGLRGLRGVTFIFSKKNGDLVDIFYKNGSSDRWDGPALSALADEAKEYGEKKVAVRQVVRDDNPTYPALGPARMDNGDRKDNPVYPALGPARMDNPAPASSCGCGGSCGSCSREDNPVKEKLPLKLLQPRLSNPAWWDKAKAHGRALVARARGGKKEEAPVSSRQPAGVHKVYDEAAEPESFVVARVNTGGTSRHGQIRTTAAKLRKAFGPPNVAADDNGGAEWNFDGPGGPYTIYEGKGDARRGVWGVGSKGDTARFLRWARAMIKSGGKYKPRAARRARHDNPAEARDDNPAQVHAVHRAPASRSHGSLGQREADVLNEMRKHGSMRAETIDHDVRDGLLREGLIVATMRGELGEGHKVYVLVGRQDNPLVGGCGPEAISENVRRELHAHPEMPVAQGVAIAYSHARAEGCRLPKRRRANPTAAGTEVADTILEQLGGMNRLAMMVGAKHFVALEQGVQFSVGSGAKSGINKVRVVLQPSDTYDVEFWRVRGANMKKVSEWGDVYNNQLMDLFEKETGMYLTIKPRRDNPLGDSYPGHQDDEDDADHTVRWVVEEHHVPSAGKEYSTFWPFPSREAADEWVLEREREFRRHGLVFTHRVMTKEERLSQKKARKGNCAPCAVAGAA